MRKPTSQDQEQFVSKQFAALTDDLSQCLSSCFLSLTWPEHSRCRTSRWCSWWWWWWWWW